MITLSAIKFSQMIFRNINAFIIQVIINVKTNLLYALIIIVLLMESILEEIKTYVLSSRQEIMIRFAFSIMTEQLVNLILNLVQMLELIVTVTFFLIIKGNVVRKAQVVMKLKENVILHFIT